MKYLLLFLSVLTYAQDQKFVTLDEETYEFVEEVNYSLYSNKKVVFTGISSKGAATTLPNAIVFDSISFNKFNYKNKGFKKEDLKAVVLLTKSVFELDEVVVVGAKRKEFILGEKNRIINKRAVSLSATPHAGLFFKNFEFKDKTLDKFIFYVNKVRHKTTYKIKFYSAEEITDSPGFIRLKLHEVLFESPVLALNKGIKNKVEVDFRNYTINLANKDVFVTLELQAYYDENNNAMQPEMDDRTKFKVQLSSKQNFYQSLSGKNIKQSTESIYNINSWINYDFAFAFFMPTPKFNLVAPAFLFKMIPSKKGEE
jgi:hypothetical protein